MSGKLEKRLRREQSFTYSLVWAKLRAPGNLTQESAPKFFSDKIKEGDQTPVWLIAMAGRYLIERIMISLLLGEK